MDGQGRSGADASDRYEGDFGLFIDATNGQTWISQDFQCMGHVTYRAICWVRASQRGATIRLQSTQTWNDFAIAEHSGSGNWERLTAIGQITNEGPLLMARVKIQVAQGIVAWFDAVEVQAIYP